MYTFVAIERFSQTSHKRQRVPIQIDVRLLNQVIGVLGEVTHQCALCIGGGGKSLHDQSIPQPRILDLPGLHELVPRALGQSKPIILQPDPDALQLITQASNLGKDHGKRRLRLQLTHGIGHVRRHGLHIETNLLVYALVIVDKWHDASLGVQTEAQSALLDHLHDLRWQIGDHPHFVIAEEFLDEAH